MLVSIVIPTRNEEDNIARLLSEFNFADNGLSYETIVVDDSTDKTAEIAAMNGARVVKGQGKGLGVAIIDGIKNAKGEIVVVMDGDGQHPASAIPRLLKPIFEEGVDMVIGSRHMEGGSYPDFDFLRRVNTKLGGWIGKLATGLTDATSGFFAFRKSILGEESAAEV